MVAVSEVGAPKRFDGFEALLRSRGAEILAIQFCRGGKRRTAENSLDSSAHGP
jgi:hypothetical protein